MAFLLTTKRRLLAVSHKKNEKATISGSLLLRGSPYGNRTRVSSVKGTCPNP